jgi:hypothetical protein
MEREKRLSNISNALISISSLLNIQIEQINDIRREMRIEENEKFKDEESAK